MTTENTRVPCRVVPDRDSRYMGEAWMKAAFSKDPSTQVGAVIVGLNNKPLGAGYNGPPFKINDNDFSWERPPKDDPDAFSKYDVVVHAERNAIRQAKYSDMCGATIYVTALPCPDCMLAIVTEEIQRVVYFNYQSTPNSCLQNAAWREKTVRIAQMGRVQLVEFNGHINWMADWIKKLDDLGIFGC